MHEVTSVTGYLAGMKPPRAERRLHVHVTHGYERHDPWYWLRHRDDPAVIAHLEAENEYARAVMAPHKELEEELYREMKGRIQETDLSVPVRRDHWLYYTKTEEGKQYPMLYRSPVTDPSIRPSVYPSSVPDGQLLLDHNALAAGSEYFKLAAWDPSPDHKLLAYVTDTSGDEKHDLQVLDIASGSLLPDRVEGIAAAVEWSADGQWLFYVTLDETQRPFRVMRHRLGTPQDADQLVFEEPDGLYFLSLFKTRSERYLVIHLGSHSTSEVWLLDAEDPTSGPRLVEPRRHEIEYTVEHHGDRLFITTNDGAVNFRLVEAPVATPSRAHWRDVIPGRDDVRLEGVDAFRNHLVIWERKDATPELRIRNLETGAEHYVEFPEPVRSVNAGPNPEFDTTMLRFTYTSMVTPPCVIDYGMDDGKWDVRKQQPVLGGYDPSRYRTERLFARAPDGTRVPISVVYRLPLEKDGTRPMLLTGYGSYGITIDPSFSSNWVSLLDRGVIVALAHPRGGEDLGRPWYQQGKKLEKWNTFRDFIAVAEHLVKEKWTSPDRLAISGGSAGGLLMGVVTNARPDLFRAVVADVPFVDVVTTMLDPSIPLTVLEYEEWGNPNDLVYFEYMRSYSPYDNVTDAEYPAMLVTAGLNDPRVAYWEPAKWVAKLREHNTGNNPILLKTNMGAGHGGASGRYDYLKEVAFKYAFILSALDVIG